MTPRRITRLVPASGLVTDATVGVWGMETYFDSTEVDVGWLLLHANDISSC